MRIIDPFKKAVGAGLALTLSASSIPYVDESPSVSREVYMLRNGMIDRIDRNTRDYLTSRDVEIIEELWNPFPATAMDSDDHNAKATHLTMVDGVAYAKTAGFYCSVGSGFMLMGTSPLNLRDLAKDYGFYEERLAVLFMMHEFGHALTLKLNYSDVNGINVTDAKKRSETQSDFYGLLAIHYYYGRQASINDSRLLENFRTDSITLAHKNPESIAWLRDNYLSNTNIKLRSFGDMVETARQAYARYIETAYAPETKIEPYRSNTSTQNACSVARNLKLGG